VEELCCTRTHVWIVARRQQPRNRGRARCHRSGGRPLRRVGGPVGPPNAARPASAAVSEAARTKRVELALSLFGRGKRRQVWVVRINVVALQRLVAVVRLKRGLQLVEDQPAERDRMGLRVGGGKRVGGLADGGCKRSRVDTPPRK